MRTAEILTALTLACAAGVGPALAEGSASKGRAYSENNCVRCHVVSETTKYAGIGSTPSFFLLAKRDDYQERFSTFFERRPHPSFVRMEGATRWTDLPPPVEPFEVSIEELDNVIAYIETLRAE